MNVAFFRLPLSSLIMAASCLVACSGGSSASSNGTSDGSVSNVASDGAADGGVGRSGDASTPGNADGGGTPPPADGGGCTSATIVCNGVCLAAGQSAGGCTALVAGLDSRAMTVAAGYVYYDVSGAVWRVPTTGGTPTSFATAAPYIEAMIADSTNLYLTAAGSAASNAVVGYAPLAGGAFKTLDTTTTGTPQIGGIALDAANVYWIESPLYSGTPPAIYKVPVAGGSTASPIGKAQDPVAIAVDSTNVYWADSNTGVVWGTPTATAGTIPLGDAGANAGGAVDLFTTPVNLVPSDFAVDPNYLYWADGNTLSRWPKDGGATENLANDYAGALALDGTNIYALTELGQILRYDMVAMSGKVLATVPGRAIGAITVDAINVYVLAAPLGMGIAGIVRVAK